MHCPKCGHAIKRFATMRVQRFSCPHCGTGLEPVHMRAPLLMFLLTLLPLQLTSLARSYQFRPGGFGLIMFDIGYAAAWAALILLFVYEYRRPRLKERKKPQPKIRLNLNAPYKSNSR